MIISDTHSITTSNPSSFAWSGLRRSQNVDLLAGRLMQMHAVPDRHRDNVRKQATQIRYCLIQAREYFAAAASVSLATKPNLLYYGTMSLALAEILFKQSGESSLDKARAENRHHGLTMTVGGFPKLPNLKVAAQQLRARPVIVDGKRTGTFELWHCSSREHPVIGLRTESQATGGSTSGYYILNGASDQPYKKIPDEGITLAEALQGIPGLAEEVTNAGLTSQVVRGTTRLEVSPGDQWFSRMQILFHPNPLAGKVIEQICVAPRDVESISCQQIGSGYEIIITSDWRHTVGNIPLPPAATVTTKEWRMWSDNPCLNEFGFFYVALYLAGNYARYFPDKWLHDVETSSPLALALERLCELSEWRVPWLALCELDLALCALDTWSP